MEIRVHVERKCGVFKSSRYNSKVALVIGAGETNVYRTVYNFRETRLSGQSLLNTLSYPEVIP
jgi:hypothetical protein